MRDAKRHGKLLSDVVEASWNHLRLASHPISYLRTLLRVPVDFAYRVRVQRAEVAQQQQQRQRAQYVETTVMHLAGASFVSRDGLRSYSISDDAKSVIIHHRDETHPRVHAGNWAREFLGALEAGHIVRVAPDTSTFDSRIVRHGIAVAAPSASVSGGDRPSESTQPRDNPLHDLRQLLRLKQARATPTNKPRDAAKHMNHERRGAFPLSTLLHVISGSASSRA